MKMKGKLRNFIVISTCIVFVISVFIYINQHKELSAKYNEALKYADKGDYIKAREIMSGIGEYKNTDELIADYTNEIEYQAAQEYILNEDYDSALVLLERINAATRGYKQSIDMQNEVEYKRAIKLASEGKLHEAYEAFKSMPVTYSDVVERRTEVSYAIEFADKWYCKEHQIDLEITGRVTEDNVVLLDVEMRDRNGFLLDAETNKLTGTDLQLMEDRFIWNLLGDDTKYAIIMENNKLKVAKHPITNSNYIVTFSRKLEGYNSVDGDIDADVKMDINKGV